MVPLNRQSASSSQTLGATKEYKPHMKITLSIFLLISSLYTCVIAQTRTYEILEDEDQNLINDLTSTFKDQSIPFLLSPFVRHSIDTSMLDIPHLEKDYRFEKVKFKMQNNESKLLNRNDFLLILNPDSLIKYESIDNAESFEDPVLENISKYYGKMGICEFRRIIYSQNREYAIIEYWMNCGFLCGFGEVVLMKKKNNHWTKYRPLVLSES